MRKFSIILTAVILFGVVQANSNENLKLVKEIDINNVSFGELDSYVVEFHSQNGKIAKHKCIELMPLIPKSLQGSNYIIEVIDKNGSSFVTSAEIDEEIAQQTPLLLFDAEMESSGMVSLGDTLTLNEDELNNLIENKELNAQLASVTNMRLQLNAENLTNKKIKQYFKPKSIIFPIDKSTKRWIEEVRKIRIYSY